MFGIIWFEFFWWIWFIGISISWNYFFDLICPFQIFCCAPKSLKFTVLWFYFLFSGIPFTICSWYMVPRSLIVGILKSDFGWSEKLILWGRIPAVSSVYILKALMSILVVARPDWFILFIFLNYSFYFLLFLFILFCCQFWRVLMAFQ